MRLLKKLLPLVMLLNLASLVVALGLRQKYLAQVVGDEQVNAVAVLGGDERKFPAGRFGGGFVRAIMGGVELDLTEASIDEAPVVLEVTVVMGGAEVRVPRDWKVANRTGARLGDVDVAAREPRGDEEPDLILTGPVVMGSLEIRARD